MKRLTIRVGIPLVLSTGVVLALLWLLGGHSMPVAAEQVAVPLPAPSTAITVCLGGDCDYDSIQVAVDAASSGDWIKVAQGAYTDVHVRAGITQVVYISKSVIIQGGYTTTNWSEPSPATLPTILDAGEQGRGISVIGDGIVVTLDGLRVTAGDATLGGGPSGSPDVGGGIYIDSDDCTVANSWVYSNTAVSGGGVYVYESDDAMLMNSAIYSNTASFGGGVYVYRGQNASLVDNDIYSNITSSSGGGVYLHLTGDPILMGNEVFSNTSHSNGGGVYLGSVWGSTVLSGNVVHHNTVDGGSGGGIHGMSSNGVDLTGNTVHNNTVSAQGGGIHLSGCRGATLTDNVVYENYGNSNGGGIFIGGVGSDSTILVGNVVYSNTIQLYGGGLYIHQGRWIQLLDNLIYGNTASTNNGGGIFFGSTEGAVLAGNEIYNNTGIYGGGLYLYNADDATVTSNNVHDNEAVQGGGIYVYISDDVILTNNLLAENRLAGPGVGVGLVVNKSTVRSMHNTVARNTVGDKEGIYVGNGATLWMTNTILVSHTTGIRVTAGSTATLEATLWGTGAWANSADWIDEGMLITGTLNWWQAPGFVGGSDYHLNATSAAIDVGVDAGVMDDLDGQSRPCYGGYDLGADEWCPLEVMKSATPDEVKQGEQFTYTLLLTNTTDAVIVVDVSDALPNWTDFVGPLVWSDGDGGYSSGVVTWTGTVYTSTPTLISWAVQVHSDAPYSTTITNTAVVSALLGSFSTQPAIVLISPYRLYLPIVQRNSG